MRLPRPRPRRRQGGPSPQQGPRTHASRVQATARCGEAAQHRWSRAAPVEPRCTGGAALHRWSRAAPVEPRTTGGAALHRWGRRAPSGQTPHARPLPHGCDRRARAWTRLPRDSSGLCAGTSAVISARARPPRCPAESPGPRRTPGGDGVAIRLGDGRHRHGVPWMCRYAARGARKRRVPAPDSAAQARYGAISIGCCAMGTRSGVIIGTSGRAMGY
jgi:hypothetical protein